MFKTTTPTRSPKTEADYERIYRSRARCFEKTLGMVKITPNEVAAAFLKRYELGHYAQRTWRVYKAAALHCLRKFHPECEEAINHLARTSSAGLPKKSPRTSGSKSKTVSAEALAALDNTFSARIGKYKHAQDTYNIIQATLLTGLRPSEWAHAGIGRHRKTGRLTLQVKNSKHSNGRANGEYRAMFIDQLDEIELGYLRGAIRAFAHARTEVLIEMQLKHLQYELAAAKAQAAGHPETSQATKTALSRITLYSFRHQFVADAKRALTGTQDHAVVLAALLGHNSVETAPMHYGRRRHGGTRQLKVLPTAESVRAVQQVTVRTYEVYLKSCERPYFPQP